MAFALSSDHVSTSVLQLDYFNFGISRCLDELYFGLGEYSKEFTHIKAELPVLQDTVYRFSKYVNARTIREDNEGTLLHALEECREQFKLLQSLAEKTVRTPGAAWKGKSRKAYSLHDDVDGMSMFRIFRTYIEILASYHAVTSATLRSLKKREKRLVKICDWLSAPDPSPNHQRALEQRQGGTGLWFLESEQYNKWKTDAGSLLWIQGPPGCGKTILSTAVVQDIIQCTRDDPGKRVVYFYFDFRDTQKQRPSSMLKSMITQLLQRCLEIPSALNKLFSHRALREQPTLYALLAVLQQFLKENSFVSYLILDALDECSSQAELMSIIKKIASWRIANVHILVTRRKEQDIQSSPKAIVQNSIYLHNYLVDKDIRTYVQQRLSEDQAIRHEIEAALMQQADGRFQWVVCQLNELRGCLNHSMLRRSLVQLPATLEATYDRMLSGIDSHQSEYVRCILQWLTLSTRPLRVEELAEALRIAVDGSPTFDTDQLLADPFDILRICRSLVTITDKSGHALGKPTGENLPDQQDTDTERFFSLAHHTVKEYLLSDSIQDGPAKAFGIQAAASNTLIAKSCLIYILQFQEHDCLSIETLREHSFAEYAARFWAIHARAAEQKATSMYKLIRQLFSPTNGAYLNWIRIHNLDEPWTGFNLSRSLHEVPAPLYYASLAGLTAVVRLLVNEVGVNVNATGGQYGNALQAAAGEGHEETLKVLIKAGADLNAQGGYYNSALQAASGEGHEEAVKVLIKAGADLNAQGGYNSNALQAASGEGHEEAVTVLIKAVADLNAQRKYYSNALQAASYQGHESVVKLLLESWPNPHTKYDFYSTALQAASNQGHEGVVKLLLDSWRVDPDARGEYYGTALQAASNQGHETVVKLLLSAGADVNAQGGRYGNALRAASIAGNKKVLQLLLKHGADVNAEREDLWVKAAREHTYGDISQLVEDIKVANSAGSSISMTFDCEIPAVISLEEHQLGVRREHCVDELLNHVVLVARTATSKQFRGIEALTCLEYMKRRWDPLGEQVLRDTSELYKVGPGFKLENSYKNMYQCKTRYILAFNSNFSQLSVDIDSAILDHRFVTLISAFDWLCRAIRTPKDIHNYEGLPLSSSSCRMFQSNAKHKVKIGYEPSKHGICLDFSLSIESFGYTEHDCWQQLFRSCFVVEDKGLSQYQSPHGKGLEMSFDLMVSLAAVEYPVQVNGGVVLVGYHTLLVPTQLGEDYVQFHLEVDENHQINPFTLSYGKGISVIDYTRFKNMRCFVGWCEIAHIKLGTQELPAKVNYSGAQEVRETLRLKGISAGVQALSASPLQAGLNGQAQFSFVSHRLSFSPASVYTKMLWDTSKQVVLISDVTAQRSWLVPKLSVVLHMAHAWIIENSFAQTSASSPIPFAQPHGDGTALIPVLQDHGDTIICGQGDDSFKLRSLFLGLNINLLETVSHCIRSSSKSLYGFEFMDIVTEPGRGGFMKKIKIKLGQNWLALANLVDAVIICSELGEAMAPADGNSRQSSKCNSLPAGQDYLAAHVSCLCCLAHRAGESFTQSLKSSRVILSKREFWTVSGEPFETCTHDDHSTETCWNKVRMVQKVGQNSILHAMRSILEHQHAIGPGTVSLEGAVVFGT